MKRIAQRRDPCQRIACSILVLVATAGCGKSRGHSDGDRAANTPAEVVDRSGARQRTDELIEELRAADVSEARFEEIVSEVNGLGQSGALTDMQLSDLRQAAAERWHAKDREVPEEFRELQAGVEQRGGKFSHVPLSGSVLAHFRETSVSDEDLKTAAGLEHVTTLVLWNVETITDRAIDHVVERCPKLRVLDVRGTNVSGESLAKLESIETMRKVVVDRQQATDGRVTRLMAELKRRRDADVAALVDAQHR